MQEFRKEYKKGVLTIDSVSTDPHEQFSLWFEVAKESGLNEPNKVVLSTSDENNRVSSRMVLLKEISEDGYVFYTNLESRKATDALSQPKVSLLFYWEELERQVRIEGAAKLYDREKSQAYFNKRPIKSRLGAWTSPQSKVIQDRSALDKIFSEVEKRFEGQELIPIPEFWGGIEIVPDYFEFWQGRENRLHDRIAYSKKSATRWTIDRLAP